MAKLPLIGLCDRILTGILNRLTGNAFSGLPAPVCLGPVLIANKPNNPTITLKDLLDGILYATPKNRTPFWRILRRRYGDDNWKGGGTRLFKPKRNITTCTECGSFHEYHTICRTCFKKVQQESKEIIEKIRSAWGKGVIDREVQVLYQGETLPDPSKRIVEIDRPRPLWFAPNLSQKTARVITEVKGPAIESEDRTIKIKE